MKNIKIIHQVQFVFIQGFTDVKAKSKKKEIKDGDLDGNNM